MAVRCFLSKRQNQSRTLPFPAFFRHCVRDHQVYAERLARTGMENVCASHQMRPTIARGILRWNIAVIHRSFHALAKFGFSAGTDLGERGRHYHDDVGRLLYFLVKETG